jgi:hypothetical protein
MANLTKPSERPEWATGIAADVQTPPAPKQETGWIVEIPPHQFFNWMQKFNFEWLQYFENKTDRLVGGDVTAEIAVASGVITPTMGVHYIAAETGTADDVTGIANTNLKINFTILEIKITITFS